MIATMADRAHPGVDAYIEALPAWQQEACRDELGRDALIRLLRAIVANNRAGGWRRLGKRA